MIDPQSFDDRPASASPRTLRQFAGLCLGVFGLAFALSWYRHDGVPTMAGWLSLAVALLVGVPGLVRPSVIRPLFLGAIAATRPIGHAVSVLLLGLIYYGLVTPLAVWFRVRGRDALVRRRPDASSYWVRKQPPGDVSRYLRQYQRQ